MNDIIQWLRKIEHLANQIYLQAERTFVDEPDLQSFLSHLAEEEAWHYHVMGSAAEYLEKEPNLTPAISIDQETEDKIFGYFTEIKTGLEENTLTSNELVEKIARVELTEWNDIFLYVVNVLKEKTTEFKYPAARIQAHLKEIEHFLATINKRPDVFKKLTTLDPVWIENILIVDDELILTQLMKSLLNRSGNIDIAHNGQQALELLEKKYYKLIISDIDMPVMDGLSFFRESTARYPGLHARFLFITGNLTPERVQLFTENQVKYLAKPMEIQQLRETASKIILSKNQPITKKNVA